MAPPGTKIVAYIKPNNRGTCELNGEVGWYIGPSMEHYRFVKFYFLRTKTIRDCDIVTFFPASVLFPKIKLEDFLKQAATDIITILTQPPSTTTPSLQAEDPVRNVLLTLATQLKRIEPIIPVVETVVPPPKVFEPVLAQHQTLVTQPPMVKINKPIPVFSLQELGKKLKKCKIPEYNSTFLQLMINKKKPRNQF